MHACVCGLSECLVSLANPVLMEVANLFPSCAIGCGQQGWCVLAMGGTLGGIRCELT